MLGVSFAPVSKAALWFDDRLAALSVPQLFVFRLELLVSILTRFAVFTEPTTPAYLGCVEPSSFQLLHSEHQRESANPKIVHNLVHQHFYVHACHWIETHFYVWNVVTNFLHNCLPYLHRKVASDFCYYFLVLLLFCMRQHQGLIH